MEEIKNKKWYKITSKVLGCLLGLIFVLLLGVEIISLSTKGSNYGVPNIFGYQFMNIATDSMEPKYKVGTNIIVKKVDMSLVTGKGKPKITDLDNYVDTNEDEMNYVAKDSPLKLGDDISFYWNKDGVPAPYIITHRILGMEFNEKGELVNLTCNGIHKRDGNYTGKAQYPTSELVLGKVIGQSEALGFLTKALQSPITLIILVIIPCSYLIVVSIVDIVNNVKKPELSQGEDDVFTEAEIRQEKLKYEMRQQMIKDGEIKATPMDLVSFDDLMNMKRDAKRELLNKQKEEGSLEGFSKEELEELKKQAIEEMMHGDKGDK